MLRGVLLSGIALTFLGTVPAPAFAQPMPAPAVPAPAPALAPRGPFAGGGTFGLELGGNLSSEAWNLNGSHEWLIDGSFSVWWSFKPGHSLVAEFHALPIFQDRLRNAFVNAFTPVYRWRWAERGGTTFFSEFGAGVSWSDTAVPERGTRFNFLTVMSAGAIRRLGPQSNLVAGFRWLHLSNASRFGRNRNPDIEALGGYLAVNFGF
jgi:hypothetical protein